MIWKTKITEMTGIKYPLIMGAFAGVGRAELASTFSNAGGLGVITGLNFNTNEQFQKELDKIKKLTSKPFGVNFTIMPPYMVEKVPKARTEETYLDFLDIAFEAGVKIFTTSAYHAKRLGRKIISNGGVWFHKCTTIKHAISAEKAGANAVTLVGVEGTGFKNPLQNTTLVNITMARKLLKVPIIAAGGIGDSRGFLAALAMGADAVCFGTAIMATKECSAPQNYKKKLINQNIFDEDYYKEIFHHQLKDKNIWSMAAGHIDKQLSVNEFIENRIINKAEQILKSWGFERDEFNTL